MEDDLNFFLLQMEDDLTNFVKWKATSIFFVKWKTASFFHIMKTTLNFFKMEDDLKFIENGR
jgi:hypothetical protein